MRLIAVVGTLIVLGVASGDGVSGRRVPVFVQTVRIPEPAASVMVQHVRHILDRHWGILGPGELYHGHLLMKPGMGCQGPFATWGGLMACSAMVLYHSDENIRRWRGMQSGIPLESRTPRSIVGYWDDGEVADAALLVPDPAHTARDYVGFGTIHDSDLARAMPSAVADTRVWELDLPQGSCPSFFQVMFDPDVLTTHRFTIECRDMS